MWGIYCLLMLTSRHCPCSKNLSYKSIYNQVLCNFDYFISCVRIFFFFRVCLLLVSWMECMSCFCHFWATVSKTVCPMLSDRCPVLSCPVCPVCDVRALWPNGCTDQDETWHACRPRPWPHCVRSGPSCPSPKGAQPPIFGQRALWPNGWMV